MLYQINLIPIYRCGFKPHLMRQFKERTRLSSRPSLRLLYSKTPLILKEKRRNEVREDERRYSRPVRLFEMLGQKGAVRKPHLS